jgi:formate-dependent nitrite reductase membrane component NrfD
MKKVEDSLYKLYAIMITVFMVLFFLFSVYAVIGPLHNKMWKLLIGTFFMFLLGITGMLFSYHTYLQAFKGRKSERLVKRFYLSAIVTTTYLTVFSTYLHFAVITRTL